MTEKRYSIFELQTTGWELMYENLTKEQCDEKLDEARENAIAPGRIKVQRIA